MQGWGRAPAIELDPAQIIFGLPKYSRGLIWRKSKMRGMDKPRTNGAGLIVAIVLLILLLLPVLYVGSYFALVVPEGEWIWHDYSLSGGPGIIAPGRPGWSPSCFGH